VAGTNDGIEVRETIGTDALQLFKEKPHPDKVTKETQPTMTTINPMMTP